MKALRHVGVSTGASASVVSALLQDHKTTKFTFFATESVPTGDYDECTDGDEANLPLVAALAEYNIPGFGPIYLVFDGLFLTRARRPRALEVDQVLAEAVSCGRAHFAPNRVPFTSSFSAEQAAQLLANVPTFALEPSSLSGYARLLGGP